MKTFGRSEQQDLGFRHRLLQCGDEWDRAEDRPGWRSKDGWVGARLYAELLGGSLYELEPGDRLWPYHLHHANEEWLIVVRGEPTLRTSAGEQQLVEGDVVVFPRGKDGAHQVSNRTDTPIRVLMLSSMVRCSTTGRAKSRSGPTSNRSMSGAAVLDFLPWDWSTALVI